MYCKRIQSFCFLHFRAGPGRNCQNLSVIFVNSKFFPGRYGDSKYWRIPMEPSGIDRPGEVEPEFILFPDFAGVGLISVLKLLSGPSANDAIDGLAEANPSTCIRFLAHQVVALGTVSHGEHSRQTTRSHSKWA